MTWGFKESFRSYISGSIANGEWQPIDGAAYSTPNFIWTGATGTFDPQTHTGQAQFRGGVRFTGHKGLLNTTIANPTLTFSGGSKAGELLIDLASISMEDALAGKTAAPKNHVQVPLISLDLAAAPLQVSADGSTVTGTAIPTAFTQQGYESFGSYEAGTVFDPVDVRLTLECTRKEVATADPGVMTETPGSAATTAPTVAPADTAWIGWLLGAASVGFGSALVAWLIRRRRSARS